MSTSEEDNVLLRKFAFERLLNQDTRTKVVNLLGTIDSQPAIIIAEKTAFATDQAPAHPLDSFLHPSAAIHLIERNDVYRWFLLASSQNQSSTGGGDLPQQLQQHAEVKATLIFPATDTHIRKYSVQSTRMVTETPQIYRELVLPYILSKRESGRLNWVYNILDKKAESESIIFEDADDQEGFILQPDLKWDRRTMSSLYAVALVRRRDIASIRDLKKKHVPWLRRMQTNIVKALCNKYSGMEEDQLRLYVHYQPSYYHFHVHAVAISHDGGWGQAAGRAFLLSNIISQLETIGGDGEAGFEQVELTYFLGEGNELWQKVFARLKEEKNKG